MNSAGCTSTMNSYILGHIQNGAKQTEIRRDIRVAFVTDHVFEFNHCQIFNFPQARNEHFRYRLKYFIDSLK